MVAKFPFVSKYPGITAALYRNGRIPILFSTIQPPSWKMKFSTIHVALYKNRLYSYSLLIIIVKLLSRKDDFSLLADLKLAVC